MGYCNEYITISFGVVENYVPFLLAYRFEGAHTVDINIDYIQWIKDYLKGCVCEMMVKEFCKNEELNNKKN